VRSVDAGWPNLAICPAVEAGLEVRVVTGQEAPEFQGWVAVKNHQQGEYEPTPTALYEATFHGPIRLVTLLYPIPSGKACPISGLSAGIGEADSAIRIKLADGTEQVLDEKKFSI
jgi:hypothetical protein